MAVTTKYVDVNCFSKGKFLMSSSYFRSTIFDFFKFICYRVLEVLLPANLAKQLAQIRKAVANKKICRLIQCKRIKPNELKSKIVESKIMSDLETIEVITKVPDKKQKGKTEVPTTATKLSPKQSTKVTEPKPTDKKQHKDAEKKLIKGQPTLSKDSTDKKPAQKKDEGKKAKLTKPNNDTE